MSDLGDADPISPLTIRQALAAGLPSSILHIIIGGTHMLAHERPDEIAVLIIEHLS